MEKSKKNQKFKKIQNEDDPILKKKQKKNPKNEEKPLINPQDDPNITNNPLVESEEIINQPIISEYEKFLRKYKIKKGDLSEKKDGSNVKKIPYNEIQLLKIPRVKFFEKKNYKSYLRHFDEDFKKFTSKIIEDGAKSSDSKTGLEFLKDFSFTPLENDNDNHIIKNKNENDILNNNIKIRSYIMKKEFKRSKAEFCSNYFEKLIADKNAQVFIESEGIQQNPIIHKKIVHILKQEEFDQEDSELLSFLNDYLDFIYIGPEENEFLKFRKVWLLHVLNHILNGNDEFKSNAKEIEENDNQNNEKIRNKGFNRCKILILTPYKRDGYEIIMDMIEYFSKGTLKKTSHKARFMQEFGVQDAEIQDDFKIGLSFANKNINLYTAFTNSDIIIASPLGLRLVTGAHGDENREFSFLSSIEILVIDQANILFMQNWQHIEEILQIMNKTPKYKEMTNSLDEIREYHFENLSKFYRQTIVSSQYNFPELNSINIRFFNNYKGCLQNKLTYLPIVLESFNNFSIEFMKLELNNFEEDFIQRFEYFKNKIWLKINDRQDMFKTVIFVNSYYEYIKLRNYFKKTNSFVQFICEYTSKGSVQSRLSQFNKKNIPFLLFSERAYFFKICELKNICNIIFYSLPKNESIYKNLIMSLQDPNSKSKNENKGPSFKNKVKCVFSKYDAFFLEKLVGTEGMKEFLAEYNKASTFIL